MGKKNAIWCSFFEKICIRVLDRTKKQWYSTARSYD